MYKIQFDLVLMDVKEAKNVRISLVIRGSQDAPMVTWENDKGKHGFISL